MKTLAIVPAFNEEESIASTIEELQHTAPDIDYVVVNDGSTDTTAELCKQYGFNLISQPANLGLTGAFQTGMKYAYRHGYDSAIQFDADGQHVPAEIHRLIQLMEDSGANIVIGSRFVTEKKPLSLRMIGNTMISLFIRMTTGQRIEDPTSGLRLYDRAAIEQFAKRDDLSPEPDTIAFLMRKKSMAVKECQVKMRERAAGESYLTPSKSISYMANVCISILLSQWFRK